MSENAAKRVIKKGSEFEKYFKPFCNTTFLGYGNTDLSIKIMAKWVKKYKHQTKQLALDHFAGYNLLDTVNKIYQFAHDHFQYKLDGADQQIRSPYCAWLDRYNGIDCKSYSVIVGTILDNLGINYYFKKTKQPGYSPDQFTHVYVSIPKNQKTNSLEDYYIIDATIHNNIELPYLEAKTKLMSSKGLKHYGLGRPALGYPNPFNQLDNPYSVPAPNFGLAGYNGLAGNQNIFNDALGFFEDLSFDNLFGSIDCWGGTAFDGNILQDLIPKIVDYFLSKIDIYNQAIANQDWQNIHKIVSEIYARKDLMVRTYHAKQASKDWNSCSNSSFNFVSNFLINKIQNVLIKALHAHNVEFFTGPHPTPNQFTFKQPAHSGDMFDGVKLWGTAIPNQVETEVHSYTTIQKPKKEQIPQFIITPEIENALNSDVNNSNFSVENFLTTLVNTAMPIYDALSNNDTITNNVGDSSENIQDTEQPQPQKASFSWLQVGLLSAAAYGAWQYSKNDKKSK